MRKRKVPILVFAHGTDSPAKGGGSGFRNLVEKGRTLDLPYVVVGVCTPWANGSVAAIADKLHIPVHTLHKRPCAEQEFALMKMTGAALAVASGYLWPLRLPMHQTINIHPGSRPMTNGLHGRQVHERMILARNKESISATHMEMHFVVPYVKNADGTDNYDIGFGFAKVPIDIRPDDTADTLGKAVNAVEHAFQPAYTALVAEGRIALRSDKAPLEHYVWMENPAWYEGHDLPYT